MKQIFIFLCLILLCHSCTKKAPFNLEYKDQKDLFQCSEVEMDIIKEAVYAFEDYIASNYAFLSKDVPEGYHNYIELLFDDRAPASEFFSPHLVEIKNYLKTLDGFWIEDNGQLRLDFDSDFVACIISNMKYANVRKTLEALMVTKSIKPEVLGPFMFRNKHLMDDDRALATFLIFESFYPKLFYMDSPNFVPNSEKLKIDESLDVDTLIPLDSLMKEIQ